VEASPGPSEATEVAPKTGGETEAVQTAGFDKGFFLQSADGANKLQIGGRIQARFTYKALENAPNSAFFHVPRARVALRGHVFSEDASFKLETDFGGGSPSLKDGYVNYRFIDGLEVRAGQQKRPFSRQQINSSGKLQFPDLAITDKAFGAGRDLGVTVHNNFEKSPNFEYALGVYNGVGDKAAFTGGVQVDPMTGEGSVSGGKFSNVPSEISPAVVARVGYNTDDSRGYSEGDFEGGPLRLSVGASGWFDFQDQASGDLITKGELDFSLKAEGFSATGGFYVCSAADKTSCFGGNADALGTHVQLGYLVGDLLEPAVRVGLVGGDGQIDDQREIAVGLNLYPNKHDLKLQTQVGILSDKAADTRDVVAMTQLQLGF
jgi:hypothetical protein